MQSRMTKRTLSVTLGVDKAGRVEAEARERGLEVGDVIAKALAPIIEYPHGDCIWITLAIPTDAYRLIKKYADENGIDLNGNGSWLFDELFGVGFDRLEATGTHKE